MSMTHANDESFEREVLRADVPVLVDFTATWCPPCKMLKPVLEAIAEDMRGNLKVVAIDIDESPHTTLRYGFAARPR